MRNLYLLLTVLFFSSSAVAQYVVTGTVRDQKAGVPVQSVTVRLTALSDTTNIRSTITDSAGGFRVAVLQPDSFRVTLSTVGYGSATFGVRVDTADVNVGTIELLKEAGVLAGVTVTGYISPVTQKRDTLQYNASQFKVNPDASVEDLARKMPGITVENGEVKAQGETVQRVTIDGREFFGDDATAALRNLPAEIVDKIQVFDRLSDQAQFTEIDDGNTTKGINIVTKANMRNGQFGRVFAGYGTDSRYAAGGNATFLKENRKISLVGNFNNVNQQNFATQDLLGVTSSASRRGGGERGGGGGRGGRGGGGCGNFPSGNNAGNFMVGQQNGINRTNALGINYADNWGTKAVVSASYFFNNTNNTTNEQLSRQYYLGGTNMLQSNIANSRNTNHRVNMRLEYRIDSFNQLIISPNISLQKNNSVRDISTILYRDKVSIPDSRTINLNNNSRTGLNFNNNILYRRSFRTRGRSLSLNVNTSYNNRDGDAYTTSDTALYAGSGDSLIQRFSDQANNTLSLSANVIYTETLSQNAQLHFSYNPSYSNSKADQLSYEFEKATGNYSRFRQEVSSRFDNNTLAQNAGVAYRYGTRENQLSIGVSYQQSQLNSSQEFPRPLSVRKTFSNVLPNAMLRLKTGERSNVRFFYRARTSNPSVTQLQAVVDDSNLPFVTAGNPDLEQQYVHNLSTRYTFTNTQRGLLFVGNVFFEAANNYISNATFLPLRDSAIQNSIVLKRSMQLMKPVNLDGYMSLRSFFTFGVPLRFIKTNLNLNGGVGYNRQPGIINNVNNTSNNMTYTIGSVLASNVSEYVDFNVSYSANFNTVKNSLEEQPDQHYFSHAASVQLNLLSKKGWFFQNDLNNRLYSGLADGFNQSFYLWNMAVGKKFLKDQKGELKLSVFDLLKQNRSVVRNVTEAYIEDEQNEVLQQYFMLTFTYNLRNFGAAATRAARR